MKLTERNLQVEAEINGLPSQLPPSELPRFYNAQVSKHDLDAAPLPDGRQPAEEFYGDEFLSPHLRGNGIEGMQVGLQLIDDRLISNLMGLFERHQGFQTGVDSEAIRARLLDLKAQNAVVTDTLAYTHVLPGGARIGGTSLRGTNEKVTSLYEAVLETPILAQGMREKDSNLLKDSTDIKHDGDILEGKKNSVIVVGPDGKTIDFDTKDRAHVVTQVLLGAWITAHSIPHMNAIDDDRLYGSLMTTADKVRRAGILTARPHHTSPDVGTSTNWSLWTQMQTAIRTKQRSEARYLLGNKTRPDLEHSCDPNTLENDASYYTAVATLEAALRASQQAHPGKAPKFLVAGSGGVSQAMLRYALNERPDALNPTQFVVFNPKPTPEDEAFFTNLGVTLIKEGYLPYMNEAYFRDNGFTAVLDNTPGRLVHPEHLQAMGNHKLVLMGAANALINPEHHADAMRIVREKDIFYVNDTFINGGGVYFALIDMALRTLFEKEKFPPTLRPKIHAWIMSSLVAMTHKNIDEASRREGSFSEASSAMIDERQFEAQQRKTREYQEFSDLIRRRPLDAISALLTKLHIPNVVGDELWHLILSEAPEVKQKLTQAEIAELLLETTE